MVDLNSYYQVFPFKHQFFEIFTHPDPKYRQSISIRDARDKDQLRYLYQYLDELGCKSILVENEYVDHDFLDDYASYYAKCFCPYLRFCRRAHFWTIDIEKLGIEETFLKRDPEKIKTVKNSYLGFIVIRPLPNAVVGRTVLERWDAANDPRKIRCVRPYDLSIFGLPFSIKSLAFQEQDTVLAACATTALWTCFQQTAHVFHTRIRTPSEITRSATMYIQTSRPIPSHGLSSEQVCYAISNNGLVPELYKVNINTPINSLIYSYVSADIPVFLGYLFEDTGGRHAVAVCGYRIEDSICHDREVLDKELDLNLVGRRLSEIYVHDDGLGPFSRLKCESSDSPSWGGIFNRKGKENPRIFVRETDFDPNKTKTCIPDVIIVPVYHKIRLRFSDLLGVTGKLDKYLRALGINITDESNPYGIEWTIRLFDLKHLKEKLLQVHCTSDKKRAQLLLENQAKYLWACAASLYGKRMFTLIADATDIERSFYFCNVVFHIPGIRENIEESIRTKDPTLRHASAAGLPSEFTRFLTEFFLNAGDD